ncbi:alpha-tocopherol transfer protein-like [Pectinophora gossypiella]|uniref:alpha-tocopherol transfer protein-like n=1 Tax=Pectinophora gossypiella TaxID=13191 RepID=UPI00214F1A91|nr:alpha-tocopherol transfer protein-like [Pectinophora gossypiella]
MTIHNCKAKTYAELTKDSKKLLDVSTRDAYEEVKNCGVSPQALEDMVANIREWYDKQPHLPKGELHNEVIVRRLITQKFSIERVKEKIDNYYTARHKMPEIICNRDPLSPNLNKCLKQGYWVCLPKKTPDNKRVIIFRSFPIPEVLTEVVKIAFMIGDYRLWSDDMGGDHWIFDFRYITLQQAMQFTPMLIVKIMFFLNYCFGPKVVGMHLVNLPPFAATVLSLFKKSMKAKMVERLYTYDRFEQLYDIVPKNLFPKEYGGDEVSCEEITENWRIAFQSSPWREYFIEQDSIKTDESKRHGPTKVDEMFGATGSFRKLDFD